MMKYLLLLIAATTVFAACNTSSTQQRSATDSASGSMQPASDPRENRVAAFGDLENRIGDNSGESFAELMNFPVPEDVFAIFLEDSVFNAEYNAANRTLTKPVFLKYFPQIAESLQWPEFRELFRQIQVGKLRTSDTAHGAIRLANEPCLRYYSIQVSNDTAAISYGSDHDTYKNAGSEDGGICESATIWEFRIEARRLRFLRMYQAG
jgi:hypothetical protein